MGRMNGKVALITGAGRGQGRAHAIRLAEEGADIIALDCPAQGSIPYQLATEADLDETVKRVEALDRRIIAIHGDVRTQSDLDGAVQRGMAELGQIDTVVANAGAWTVGPFWEIPEEEWKDVLDIVVHGVVRTIRAVTPHMIERGTGSMILISSGNGREGGVNYAHYITAKHGVLGFMKAVALELGPHGIRCNAILPGVVRTPILDWQGGWDLMAGGPGLGTKESMEIGGKAYALLKDVGMLPPSAISEGVLWLASDESRYVTGLEMIIDGGHLTMPGLNMANIAAMTAEQQQ
ncbi:mycofactocin-coupled SDR family oxidoreductase [Rhodococcus opacus]|uniref:SDR family mycofactocin-dependent oxidoreductase n=1 Tax=Rhodococcus opacus TaxID=37919 RepID=A0A2S8IBM0_RHOOP|nr:mycofactocin-coupled SDR family oxidoreductase [Rhodococcus opacus]PQP12177.1 SDR family mycofactocin-dependent oxidoreductase [Rhodococcus opacus]